MKKIFFFFALFSFLSPSAFAQTQSSNISVVPSLIRIDLAQDRPQAPLTYTNNTDSTIELHLSAADFAPLEDDYRLAFLQGKDAANYKYSLSSWMHFESNDLILNPYESKTILVFIDANKLTTGAHYGTIQAEWSKNQEKSPVPIHIVLSSLIFIRTNHGNETEQASIDTFQQIQNLFSFPDQFVLRVKNTGNVDITPHGLITLTDMFGNQAATGIINQDSLLVYPESIRRYDIFLQKQVPFLWPGMYRAHMYIHFGKKDTMIKRDLAFFSLGSIPLLPTLVVLIAVGFLGWKRYFKG